MGQEFELDLTDEQAAHLNSALAGGDVELDDNEAVLLNQVLSKRNAPQPAPVPHSDGLSVVQDVSAQLAAPQQGGQGDPADAAGSYDFAPPKPQPEVPVALKEEPPAKPLDSTFRWRPGETFSEGDARERLRIGLAATPATKGSPAERALTLAAAMSVPVEVVRDNLEAWDEAYRKSDGRLDVWEKQNPVLAGIITRNPNLGPVVTASNTFGPLAKAWHEVSDPDVVAAQARKKADYEREQQNIATMGRKAWEDNARGIWELMKAGDIDMDGGPRLYAPGWSPGEAPTFEEYLRTLEEKPLTPEQVAASAQAQAERKKGTTEQQLDTPEAAAARADTSITGALNIARLRLKQNYAQNDINEAQFKLGWLEVLEEKGANNHEAVVAARSKLYDLKLANPNLYLGDTAGFSRDVSIGMQGLASTAGSMVEGVKGAGVFGAGGFVVGGAVGLGLTRGNTKVGWEMGLQTAKLAGGKGFELASFYSMFKQSAADHYSSMQEETTAQGQKFTKSEAFGAAVVEGLIEASLEHMSFNRMTAAISGPMRGQVAKQMAKNPGFRRAVIDFGLEMGKSMGTEGGTEFIQDQWAQAVTLMWKMIKDGELSAETPKLTQSLEAAHGGFMGAIASTGVSHPVGHAASSVINKVFPGPAAVEGTKAVIDQVVDGKAEAADGQVQALQALAADPATPSASAELAQSVQQQSGATHAYVDAAETLRLFQKDEEGTIGDIATAQGVSAGEARQNLEWAAKGNGGKLAIPMEAYLKSFAASKTGAALSQHTTLTEDAKTPNQRAQAAEAESKAVEDAVQRAIEEEAKAAQREAELKNLEKQFTDAGQDRSVARQVVAAAKAFMDTAEADMSQAVESLFPEGLVTAAKGDEQPAGVGRLNQEQALPSDLVAHEATLTDEQRRAAMYVDQPEHGGTGLPTRRAWDETPRTPGTQVGIITFPDVIKPFNDHPQGGHDVTNRFLAEKAGQVAPLLDGRYAARSGVDLLVEVKDQADLDALAAQLQPLAPAGTHVLGFVGATTEEAYATEKARTSDMRKAGTLPASRKDTSFDRSTLTDQSFPGAPAPVAALHPDLATKPVPKGESFVRGVLMDRQMPGVRSKAGFIAAGPRKYSGALDLKFLSLVNTRFSSEKGDALLALFAKVAMDAGGGEVFFAHLSGDEFAIKSDNQLKLYEFVEALKARLQKHGIAASLGGRPVTLRPGFRAGIDEGSYGKADQRLNYLKDLEGPGSPQLPFYELRRAGILHDGAPGSESGTGPDSGVRPNDAGGAGAVATPGTTQDEHRSMGPPDAGAAAEVAGPEAVARPPSEATWHTPEGMAEARAWVARKNPANAARFNAFLDFVEGWDSGAQRPPAALNLTGAEEKGLADDYAIIDPEMGYHFDLDTGTDLQAMTGDGSRAGSGARSERTSTSEKSRAEDQRKAFNKDVLGRLYQTKDEPRNLLVQHNMSAGDVMHADSMGDDADRSAKIAAVAQNTGVLFQDGENAPKGYSTGAWQGAAVKAAVKLFFNKGADSSTAFHELGHAFLEWYGRLAEREDATDTVRKKWASALKALGADSRQALTTKHHEKFARNFEAYLMEGKAPVKGLEGLFLRAKLWLTDIYRSITAIPGQELNDEMRAVFDSLLATEDAVNAYRRKHEGPAPTKAPAGVNEAAFFARLQEERELYDEGSRKVQLQAVKDAHRVTTKWWQAGIKKLEKSYAEEYDALPAVVTLKELSKVTLHRGAVQAIIGNAQVPGLKLAADGIPPARLASQLGWPSDTAMMAALAGQESKEKWVAKAADDEMKRLHPGILEDLERLQKDLDSGLGTVTSNRILDELAALKKMDSATKKSVDDDLKASAKKMVAAREVGRLRPAVALAAERSAAMRATVAAAKGEWDAVAEARRDQLLAGHLYGELRKAQEEVDKLTVLAQRMSKPTSRGRLGKASPALRDAVDLLLSTFGLAEPQPDLAGSSLSTAVDELIGDGVLPGIPDWFTTVDKAGPKDWRRLTMVEAVALRDALTTLSKSAEDKNTLLVDGELVDWEDAKDQLHKEIAAVMRKRDPKVAGHAMSLAEKALSSASAFDGFLRSNVDLVRDLVGDDHNTMLWKVGVQAFRDARVVEADLLQGTIVPILEGMEQMPKEMRSHLEDPIDGASLFPGHASDFLPRRRYELVMMAANAGNSSSLRVLLEGRGIKMEQLQKALDMLTAEEIAWVNKVVKSIDSLREPSFALEERITGIRPEAVEGVPMILKNGTLAGGYFPLKAEPNGTSRASTKSQGEDSLAALSDPNFTRPGTSHGHLISRTKGATYVVNLNPDVIRQHLVAVARDIAYREPVRAFGKVLLDIDKKDDDGITIDKGLVASIDERLGPDQRRQMLQALKDTAGNSPVVPGNSWHSLLVWLKGNLGPSMLSGLSTAFGNLANLAAAIPSTKLKSAHLAAALGAWSTSPLRVRRDAMALSGTLRASLGDVAGMEKKLRGVRDGKATKALRWTQEAGMTAMRLVDDMVSTVVWSAAYRQAVADGLKGEAAVNWADDILTQVQPQSAAYERASILRDKGVIGGLTTFYGYLSVAHRAQRRLVSPLFTQAFVLADTGDKTKTLAKMAGSLLAFYVCYQALGDLLMGRGPEDGDKDPEEPDNEKLKWARWLARETMVAPLSATPTPAGGLVNAAILKKKPYPRLDPINAAGSQLYEASSAIWSAVAEDGANDIAFAKGLRALGMFTGLPTRLAETTGKYLFDITFGEREVKGLGAAASGLMYGEKDKEMPENVFTVGGP